MKRICLWSGPRNISTALMYSFAQRRDTHVIDEPLYGHYLRITNANHPGREEVLKNMNCDGNSVMRDIMRDKESNFKILFMKQMSHHLQDLDDEFLQKVDNIFLIRDPKEVIPSLTIQLPDAKVSDTGLDIQWKLYQSLISMGGNPVIIDSRELLINPEFILTKLCAHLKINYSKGMLSWNPGPINEDGIWSKYWYETVHKSSTFMPYKPKPDLQKKFLPLYNKCLPYYNNLYKHALVAKRS
ncbi:MAG: hypothetical protein P8O19_01805 [Woeseiaceae bacterium]|jgi:hypothetical protein|nr:sulfotransferase family protein [Woeseiaceae bacterium]MDG1015579.1 hypothetical protein [Woeseiaceae bacterium]MDG1864720.1 hypothetical protein [Woeseiaceae bacterium]